MGIGGLTNKSPRETVWRKFDEMSENLAGQDLLVRVGEVVGDALLGAERVFIEELSSSHAYVTDVLDHAARFRGKRLRPTLLLLSAAATGGIKKDHEVLAAVLEMIHTATLVHDDVLDEAETRRHVATVNGRWNNETSVLFGDYLFTHAFHLASSLESTLACRLIGRATNIVCEGELTQLHERGNLDLAEQTYFQIIDGKTAELCASSCHLGAHFAGADEAVTQSLESYGRSLGVAFQIADDMLDIAGSEQETGKSLGSDFRKQKLTLPLIHLLRTSNAQTASRVRELFSEPNAASWAELAQLLEDSNSMEYARRRAEEYTARARAELESLEDSTAKQLLEEITEFVADRSF